MASGKLKASAKAYMAKRIRSFVRKYIGFKLAAPIVLIAILIVFIAIGVSAFQQSSAAGTCGANGVEGIVQGGSYVPTTGENNPSLVGIAYSVAVQKNASPLVMEALFATARVESKFKNYANDQYPETFAFPHDPDALDSDADSAGFLQQRPTGGAPDGKVWGTFQQVMDPSYAASRFIDMANLELQNNPSITDPATLAQEVQESAFPDRYQDELANARSLIIAASAAPPAMPDGSAPPPGAASVACGAVDGSLRDPGDGPARPEDGLRPRAANAKALVEQRYGCEAGYPPPCVSVIGGVRNDPGSDHHTGRALDVMINAGGICSPDGSPENLLGDEIEAFFQNNATATGVSYTIWENNIWLIASQKEKSQKKSGCTYAHHDHVHISFRDDPAVTGLTDASGGI